MQSIVFHDPQMPLFAFFPIFIQFFCFSKAFPDEEYVNLPWSIIAL